MSVCMRLLVCVSDCPKYGNTLDEKTKQSKKDS